jgi:hypothetical protein
MPVVIATDYLLEGRGSIPGKGKGFIYSTSSRPALKFTQPPIQRVPGTLSSGVKRSEHEADRSPPSSAKVKSGGAIPPHTPHIFVA